ncbi:TerD family protein [Actinacidiphila acidipaludis]|uniref:TerD domain-containing protein n=1 Tax=Actinacidiphila acidipaludis TaxID=2873382 RepID=A0ABS7QFQ8_9ACTN|nr:TerD family protein [Streptomyces acidipaludis]MBY8880604.1 TerD domain-containing protein [Streptomyces acidipaludis]
MTLRRGENTPLPTDVVRVEFGRTADGGGPRTDLCALLLTEDRKARGAGDFVHAAAPVHGSGAVRYEGGTAAGGRLVDTLALDLSAVEPGIATVLVVARGDGGPFGRVPDMSVRALANNTEVARYDCGGAAGETAYVLAECYRRGGGWRFRAVGQGYASGLPDLAAAYGLGPDAVPALPSVPAGGIGVAAGGGRTVPATAPGPGPVPAPVPAPAPEPAPAPAPVLLTKVTLTKQAPAVSLTKQGATSGALRVTLDWQAQQRRWGQRPVDLDLCALYELDDGSKGVVQALGNSFGALDRPPYILLDGDDRAGGTGEHLTLNLDRAASFRRVLVFVTIYEGARSFAGLHATVTLRPERGAEVDFTLDECTVESPVCALALLVREGDELVVHREARYLVPRRGVSPQRTADYAYGWGLAWKPGRK